MEQLLLQFDIESDHHANAGAQARSLANSLIGIEGVAETKIVKANPDAMDVGSIVQVIAASGATHAIATGIAAWLRARRNVRLKYKRDPKTGSIQAEVHGIDPQAATRIIELLGQPGG